MDYLQYKGQINLIWSTIGPAVLNLVINGLPSILYGNSNIQMLIL